MYNKNIRYITCSQYSRPIQNCTYKNSYETYDVQKKAVKENTMKADNPSTSHVINSDDLCAIYTLLSVGKLHYKCE